MHICMPIINIFGAIIHSYLLGLNLVAVFYFLFASVHSINWALMVMSALGTSSQPPNLAWYSSHSTNLAFTPRSKVWLKWLSRVFLILTTHSCIFSPFHPGSNGNEGLLSKRAADHLTYSGSCHTSSVCKKSLGEASGCSTTGL